MHAYNTKAIIVSEYHCIKIGKYILQFTLTLAESQSIQALLKLVWIEVIAVSSSGKITKPKDVRQLAIKNLWCNLPNSKPSLLCLHPARLMNKIH